MDFDQSRLRSVAAGAIAVCFVVGSARSLAGQTSRPPDRGKFVAETVTVRGRSIPYSVHLPAGFTRTRRWPVILALHGSGSRGKDGVAHRRQSVVAAARAFPDRYPAILVLPQCPREETWLGPAGEAALLALAEAGADYPVDSTRIYLVGQSMGSDGGFRLLDERPRLFAAFIGAAVGWGNPVFRPESLTSVPVRLFHGTQDRVPIARARSRIERLDAAGHPDAKLRPYPGRGHDIFDDVYRDSTVSTWLFAQRRRR